MGGGPIYDIGIYSINAARYRFRSEPDDVFAYSATSRDKRFAEVEEMTSAVLRFPDNQLASFTCSFGAADRSTYEVIGTEGPIQTDPAYEMAGDLKCKLTVDGKIRTITYKKRDQFGAELVYFSDCGLNDTGPEPGGAAGLADVRIITAPQDSAQNGRPVKISPVASGKQPSPAQEIHKTAVAKTMLVRATSPSL